MSDETFDPWKSLASELGVDAEMPAPPPPPTPVPSPTAASSATTSTPPAKKPTSNWNALANDLGIEVPPESEETMIRNDPVAELLGWPQKSRSDVPDELSKHEEPHDDVDPWDSREVRGRWGDESDLPFDEEADAESTRANPEELDREASGPSDGGERRGRRRRGRRGRGRRGEGRELEPRSDAASRSSEVVDDLAEPEFVEDLEVDALDLGDEETSGERQSEDDSDENKSGRRRRRGRRRGRGKDRGEKRETTAEQAGDSREPRPARTTSGDRTTGSGRTVDSGRRHVEDDELEDEDEGEEMGGEGRRGRHSVRDIMTWREAISIIVDNNLQERSRNPRSGGSGGGRGRRGGRRN